MRKYLKSIVIALIILILSLIPTNQINDTQLINVPHADKIVHFCMYAFLAFILYYESYCIKKYHTIFLITATSMVVSYGFIIELLQKFATQYRSFELADAFVNTLGAIAGSLFFHFILRKLLIRQTTL